MNNRALSIKKRARNGQEPIGPSLAHTTKLRELEVKETTDGVFAYTKLNAASGYKSGAQNALPALSLKKIKLAN